MYLALLSKYSFVYEDHPNYKQLKLNVEIDLMGVMEDSGLTEEFVFALADANQQSLDPE